MDFSLAAFVCDICRAELIDNENAESAKGNQDRMQRFNFQIRFIREGLRKTEEIVLPASVVTSTVNVHVQFCAYNFLC
jgi:transcription initiation factor TFIIE subunit alpha